MPEYSYIGDGLFARVERNGVVVSGASGGVWMTLPTAYKLLTILQETLTKGEIHADNISPQGD